MLSTIIIYAAICFVCLPLVLFMIHNANEGWEDEHGFHNAIQLPKTSNSVSRIKPVLHQKSNLIIQRTKF